MLKLSARVMVKGNDGETHVDFYVRSERANSKLFDRAAGEDGWAAYRQTPVFYSVGSDLRQALDVERVSPSTRRTIEEAAVDMYAAIHALGGRVVWGDVPEAPILVGEDPMGDE